MPGVGQTAWRQVGFVENPISDEHVVGLHESIHNFLSKKKQNHVILLPLVVSNGKAEGE